tara:strand:+ start:10798 stop:11487 length:690 start_codon:yes stop_codon:yes gene_type:complete
MIMMTRSKKIRFIPREEWRHKSGASYNRVGTLVAVSEESLKGMFLSMVQVKMNELKVKHPKSGEWHDAKLWNSPMERRWAVTPVANIEGLEYATPAVLYHDLIYGRYYCRSQKSFLSKNEGQGYTFSLKKVHNSPWHEDEFKATHKNPVHCPLKLIANCSKDEAKSFFDNIGHSVPLILGAGKGWDVSELEGKMPPIELAGLSGLDRVFFQGDSGIAKQASNIIIGRYK